MMCNWWWFLKTTTLHAYSSPLAGPLGYAYTVCGVCFCCLLLWGVFFGRAICLSAWQQQQQHARLVKVCHTNAQHIHAAGIHQGGKQGRQRGHQLCVDDMLRMVCNPTTELGAYRDPRPVHRLDGPTGGLLLVAKTSQALKTLAAEFATRRVVKRYQAVVWGALEGHGVVDAPLQGQPSRTSYQRVRGVASEQGALTVVDMWPKTGASGDRFVLLLLW